MPSTMPMSALLSALRGAGRQHLTASTVAARQAITGTHVFRLHGYKQLIRKKLPTGKSLEYLNVLDNCRIISSKYQIINMNHCD